MRVLFITASAYLPQARGGMQSSANELCIALKNRGHRVAVLAGFKPNGFVGWKSRLKMEINRRRCGFSVSREIMPEYRLWRARLPWDALGHVVGEEKPDVVVVMSGQPLRMALAAKRSHIPVVMLLQNVEFHLLGGSFDELGNVVCVANSRFTAGKYRATFGISPRVIYPFVSLSLYRTQRTPQNITFVNPLPVKGRGSPLVRATMP